MREAFMRFCAVVLVVLASTPNVRSAVSLQPPQSCVIFDQTQWAPRDIDKQ
jgi:hypothetical protein